MFSTMNIKWEYIKLLHSRRLRTAESEGKGKKLPDATNRPEKESEFAPNVRVYLAQHPPKEGKMSC